MTPSSDRHGVSYQTLFLYVALPIIFGIVGFLMRDLYAEVKEIRDNKLDKIEFYKAVDRINSKEDLIIQLLRDHESISTKRYEK